jgi:shikimate dehydrogenase
VSARTAGGILTSRRFLQNEGVTLLFLPPIVTDIVINATSIGLYPRVNDRLDIDTESLKPAMIVADVIPNPPRTNLLKDAQRRGCTVVDGLGMLVNQGVIVIKYWTGIDVDARIMRQKLEEIYSDE